MRDQHFAKFSRDYPPIKAARLPIAKDRHFDFFLHSEWSVSIICGWKLQSFVQGQDQIKYPHVQYKRPCPARPSAMSTWSSRLGSCSTAIRSSTAHISL